MADSSRTGMGVRHDDELSSEELEQAAGGLDVDAYCPVTNSGCNMVAGCGGGTKPGTSVGTVQ